MDYKKMTETRQSCRAFDPVRTPDRAVLTQVLEAARLAPSACNSQPYHFYVAVDGTARAVGAATQSLGMNKFAGDCPAFIVVAEQPYNRSAAVGAKLKDQDYRAAETLVATHPDLAARQLDPPVPERSWDRFEPQHDQMVRTGAASADITLRTSIGMTDETFARALAAAKAEGRNTVHVKVWLPLPAACPAQSNITLDSFTAQPTYIAPETAPQRTAYWEADLAENCRFGAQYSYRSTAHYAAPLEMQADPVQPDFDTAEQLPHIAFTPYMKALAAQLTEGITDPVQKAKRIYDFVTLNVHYHFQPMYFVHENITDNCARSRRGDCGVMAATFITLCRIAGIPAKWQSGMVARPETAGCHDWAMFYIAPKGWMYADCSAGASMARAGNEKMRLHYFGNLDTDRMVANSDICAPFDPPMCSFRADPCDNQVGEMEVDDVGLYGQQVETTQEIVKHQEV